MNAPNPAPAHLPMPRPPGRLQEHVSADFPFEHRFVEVLGSRMHYIDEGEGPVVLFLHGNPSSLYCWRNIVPHVAEGHRCIAVDLIGMGDSDKPDIDYTYDDHSAHLACFIDALDLGDDITLVIHDWGSMLGFRWASENPDRVRAIAFMEGVVRPMSYRDLPGALKVGMRVMRNPFFNWLMIGVGNALLAGPFGELTLRPMAPEVEAEYRRYFPTVASRKAMRMFPREVPFDGHPAHSHAIVTSYIDWLSKTDTPMLMLHGDQGVTTQAREIAWLKDNVTNLEVVDLGPGKHFLQESHPDTIGRSIAHWRARH